MSEKRKHRIVVTSELKNPPDLQRLSRAIINIAKEKEGKADDTPNGSDSQTGAPYPSERPDP